MKWLRWYHGTASDPKMGGISIRTGQSVGDVISTWALILESASEAEDRGVIKTTPEEVAHVLRREVGDVEAIWAAMEDRGLIEDGRVASWEKRNPKEDKSTERVRRYRKKQRKEVAETETKRDETRSTPNETALEVDTEEEVEGDSSSSEEHGASGDAPLPIKKRFPATPAKFGGQYAYPSEFEAAWEAYPSRGGGNPKMGGYKAWRARVVRGEPPDNLLAAAEHYATHCAVKEMEGTNFVQQTATFYGPSEPYQEFVEGPGLNGHSPRSPPNPLTPGQRQQYSRIRTELEESGMGPERAAEQAMEQVRGSP